MFSIVMVVIVVHSSIGIHGSSGIMMHGSVSVVEIRYLFSRNYFFCGKSILSGAIPGLTMLCSGSPVRVHVVLLFPLFFLDVFLLHVGEGELHLVLGDAVFRRHIHAEGNSFVPL